MPYLNQEESIARLSLLQKINKLSRRILKLVVLFHLLVVVILLVIDATTSYIVRDKVYTEISQIPPQEYAVVLGTAKFYSKNVINEYYKYRLEAAKQLVNNKKVEQLLLSGDNKTPYYNEPKMMMNDLLKMGVSRHQIRQDYAGYTTFDSILRAKLVYKLPRFVIVSQKFHCERALLIAKFRDIDAICYVAKYPDGAYQVRLREFVARGGMLINLLFGRMPETLEEIPSK